MAAWFFTTSAFIFLLAPWFVCADQPRIMKSEHIVGQTYVYDDVYSPQLRNHRTVRVWTPPSYNADSKRRYPVIYVHDGQNAFDPESSNWNTEWKIDEALSALEKRDPKFSAIVVAIDAINDLRMSEYDYLDDGERYANFLINVVKPQVDRDFRTVSGPEGTYTLGASMGALISVALVWKHPEVFSRAGGLSFPAAIHEGSIFTTIAEPTTALDSMRFYLDHGTKGLDRSYEPAAKQFCAELLARGVQSKNIKYRIFKNADHTDKDWAARISKPLRWLLR